MNKRMKKKYREYYKKEMMHIMIYNRAHIEWAYAKYLPIFKNIRNYQRAVKYRLKLHMKTGDPRLLCCPWGEPIGKNKNYDYLRKAFSEWSGPRMCELSAKHILPYVNAEAGYYAKYYMIMAWKTSIDDLINMQKPEPVAKEVFENRTDETIQHCEEMLDAMTSDRKAVKEKILNGEDVPIPDNTSLEYRIATYNDYGAHGEES